MSQQNSTGNNENTIQLKSTNFVTFFSVIIFPTNLERKLVILLDYTYEMTQYGTSPNQSHVEKTSAIC